ncbi:MAG: substrate-binding domain-containing protein [Lachnospiraceae bacterium]|nr:substrate-binding domain-containing protein [Lachnospiraceae bacterium]
MAIDHEKYPHALPEGTILAGEYIIESVLGEGGFGITYAALDHKTKERVAVKEYFPDSMATRLDHSRVTPYSGDRGENFEYGKECFLREARTLAEFIGNENIVRIFTYFEENGTAYFAMEYVEGTSFDRYISEHGGKLPYDEVCRILFPIMDALNAVHEKGIIHRDISPDNIYITADGNIRLLDFGAARYSLGDRSCSLDVVLKPGYAPKEQYTRRGRQGPFTDVYALAATFYFALTGKKPLSSIDRLEEDDLARPSALGADIGPVAEEALLQALELRSQDRYQSMTAFKQAMLDAGIAARPQAAPYGSGSPTDSFASAEAGVPASPFPAPAVSVSSGDIPKKRERGAGFYTLIAAAILLPLLVVGGLFASGIFSSGESTTDSGRRGRGESGTNAEQDYYANDNGNSPSSQKSPDLHVLLPDDPSPTPTGDRRKDSDHLVKVGIINNPPAESGYRAANVRDLEEVFSLKNGYETKTCYSLRAEDQQQAALSFIKDGVDYLLISAADDGGWDEVLRKAKESGIKVYLFDRSLSVDESLYEALIVSDMEKEGETAVNWLLSLNLPEYNVIHLQGAMGSEAQSGRTAALDAQFAAGRMNSVRQQTATWDESEAKKIVESVIAGGQSFNVIYAENDGMAKGAVAALDEAGITHGVNGEVIIISFDCNKWALRELLAGYWNYDVQCSPFHAPVIDELIRTGRTPSSKTIILEDRGFDARTITQADVDRYGLGD